MFFFQNLDIAVVEFPDRTFPVSKLVSGNALCNEGSPERNILTMNEHAVPCHVQAQAMVHPFCKQRVIEHFTDVFLAAPASADHDKVSVSAVRFSLHENRVECLPVHVVPLKPVSVVILSQGRLVSECTSYQLID